MTPLIIRAYTLVNALGRGAAASRKALEQCHGGLRLGDFGDSVSDTWLGRVSGVDDERLPDEFSDFDCRNNRLAQMSLEEDGFAERVSAARARHGENRIGVFLGTSTSGSLDFENAFRARDPDHGTLPATFHYEQTLDTMSLGEFVRRRLRVSGPAMVVSTACSSSAKVFAAASRHLQAGTCDAAVVGGVDSLCYSTLHGFRSLGVVSDDVCRPWDARRQGMNIGEGAGFALLERPQLGENGIGLLGYGESSDAHHMASPHPEGVGAVAAMAQALERARLSADSIDYVNLHGTGTRANDEVEDRAVREVIGVHTPCSSTKGWTGHTLGAAGVTEALFSVVSIEAGFIPGTLNTHLVDPDLSACILTDNRDQSVDRVLTNSFGFGGTNCSLVLGRL